MKRQEGGFVGALLASLVEPVVSSVVEGISRRGVTRSVRRYVDENYKLHSIL